MKKLVLLAILGLPGLLHADVWRWRDVRGHLHYSNVADGVPAHATVLKREIGLLAGDLPAPDAKMIEADLAAYAKLHAERAAARQTPPVPAPASYSYAWPGGIAVTQIVAPSLCFGEFPCDPSRLLSQSAPVNLWLWQARWQLAWREMGVVY